MIYKEAEYFDKFYPKSWGDWRKEYNLKMYCKHPRESGCTWMDYYETGYLLTEDFSGRMAVRTISRPEIIERFFIKTECKFIQPAFQPKTEEYYCSVTLTKMESNLDLYKIYITGNDDSSYTKHYISLNDAITDIELIKEYGISHIQNEEYKYFFTN